MAASPSSHKPRRKMKSPQAESRLLSSGTAASADTISKAPDIPFPLTAFFWPARDPGSLRLLVPLTVIAVFLYKWAAGFWGYSGFQSPPMHGDFEAQRHWMEITIHLPITEWYFHDLEWWGLDYPPLTAYHSWVLGKIGDLINPTWFALKTSRGLDDQDLKVFMRSTVIISEYLTYVPALILCIRRFARGQSVNRWDAAVAFAAVLMQPGTILIDNAHFQYNTVMLGLVVASLAAALSDRPYRASFYFVLALGFKQMALYYAPAVFAFLLGSCVVPRIRVGRLIGIAVTTIVTFALILTPFVVGALHDVHVKGIRPKDLPTTPILSSLNISADAYVYPVAIQLTQAVHRIFPFARGLFEDKVANVWCALHTFHKLHQYPKDLLQKASLGATILSILPPCLAIGVHPSPRLYPLALATTAWGFFLFSFQVHEKSVLLPLLPMLLLLAGRDGLLPATRAWVTFANVLGSWTMFPLLKRDELRVPYFVLTLLWAYLMGAGSMLFAKPKQASPNAGLHPLTRLFHGVFYTGMIAWHFAEAFAPPIAGKPDIWVVANVLVGAAGFAMCYLWCLVQLLSGVREDWSQRAKLMAGKKKS